ncbi:HlyD family secretion protein [Haloferula sp. BvORR071]|uniref:HlyD family secretion protein n=1 Tax=Haloferula sp. BvORR071 TaxID=1396141 RepID=UPI000550674B|nr:HlyD family secretion protein [Haloferula sp. BvORR071]
MQTTSIPAASDVSGHPGTETIPNARRQSILKRALLLGLLVLAATGTAKWTHRWWTIGRFMESTDDAYVGGNVTSIAPQVSGFIARVAVEDNQLVHAGDLLVQLDDRDYRAALAKANAAVAMQQAALANLDATRHQHLATIAQAEAEVNAALAEITRSREDQSRLQRLLSAHAISAQASQQADADYQRAEAAGAKTRSALEAAQRYLEVIAAQKLQAEASLAQSLAQRESARLDLSYVELRAPVDGIVGNRSAQVGAYAGTGSQLISLVPVHGLWIDANFKESQIAGMAPGSPASVRIDSIPGKTFTGKVTSIAPATGAQFSVLPPENATGNFTRIVQRLAVRVVLDDLEGASFQLRPGLSVKAEVDTRSSGKEGS